MDVFGIALDAGGEVLRDAAIDAAYELGVFDRLPSAFADRTHRMRALLDLLVALGALARDGDRFVAGVIPPRPAVARAGWGLMADVIRRDRALDVEGGEVELRYHQHLARVGAAAARDLAELVAPIARGTSVLDLGAGVGTYAAALLEAEPSATATVVDYAEVIALARPHLARFGERVRFVAGDVTSVALEPHDIVVLANVLHLHDAARCAAIVRAAAEATRPGGIVVVKDLRVDDGRTGPYEGLAFALNMALYTGGGDVHETAVLRAWLAAAGLSPIEEHRLPSQPHGIVLVGAKPRGATRVFAEITGFALDGAPPDPAMPRSFAVMLDHATRFLERAREPEHARNLAAHYAEVMPRMREAQLASPMFQVPLDWKRLPRLTAIVERLHALQMTHDVPAEPPEAFFARTPTLATLYERTYYGGFMPLLYGYPADLAYFEARGRELGLDTLGTIDRYLAAPMLHELCHFGRDREALLPPHLDECIAGWIGVHVWPAMAFPGPDDDGAIYAAPWLSQVGQAVARAFGVRAVVRAHAGVDAWDAALPRDFIDAATRLGWSDWCKRRSLHFLADTFDPDPWVELARPYAAAREDRGFDREILRDAVRAMCLVNVRVDGSFRTHAAAPEGPIVIDARAGYVSSARRGDVDRVAPRYWIPRTLGVDRYEITLPSIAAIDGVVDHLLPTTPR